MAVPSTVPTPISLLERLRRDPDSGSWRRFVELYTPLLYQFSVRFGLPKPQAEDLVQEVFAILVRELPRFEYDAGRSFRGWLWTIFRNKCYEFRRRFDPLSNAAEAETGILAAPDPIAEFDDAEFNVYLVRRAIEVMKSEFAESTWKACWACVVEERPVAEVATELNMSAAAIYQSKSRVLRRLRQELDGMAE